MKKSLLARMLTCFSLITGSIFGSVSCNSISGPVNSQLNVKTQPVAVQANVPPEVATSDSPPKPAKLVEKSAGWFEFDVRKTTIKFPRKPVNYSADVFSTTYVMDEPIPLKLSCGENEKREECEKYPFQTEWLIQEVRVSDKGDSPFQYKISAVRLLRHERTGGVGLFTFYDEDGDRIIESFCLCDSTEFHLPAWIN